MLITKEIAAKIESCIKQTHIEVTKSYPNGSILEINSGAACFSGFDSYLSQVVGWGFKTKPKQFKEELSAIEQFYQQLNHPRVDIEFCPFVGNAIMEMLSNRGYKVSELNAISVLDLESFQLQDPSSDLFFLREIRVNELDDWASTVAKGFGLPEAQEQFSHYIRAAGTRTFGVFDKNKLVAGGTIAMHGDVGDLGVTSTLPEYRGRGLQKLLIIARLNCAKSQGLRLASVSTEPGSTSDLNIQKLGFQCVYTRLKMSR